MKIGSMLFHLVGSCPIATALPAKQICHFPMSVTVGLLQKFKTWDVLRTETQISIPSFFVDLASCRTRKPYLIGT